MFTGIISDTTTLRADQRGNQGLTLTFARPKSWTDMQLGESVAVNGICLTVAALRDDEFDCFIMPETLAKTSFGHQLPKRVNLERPLRLQDRLGGHFVQGHVDDVGTVAKLDKSDGWRLSVKFKPEFRELVVYKGSITIDGVALTITEADTTSLQVALIPHTLENTTLGTLQVGGYVNLEFDMLGKYVLNSMKASPGYATG